MILKNIIIILIISFTVFIAGCTSDNTFSTKSFENENISFDYPNTWNVTVIQNPPIPNINWLINIENPEKPTVTVKIAEIGTPQNDSVLTPIKNDNMTAPELGNNTTYKNKRYIFSKNDKFYVVIVYGVESNSENDFKDYKAQYDIILSNIHIK